jgi:hypothetical protein
MLNGLCIWNNDLAHRRSTSSRSSASSCLRRCSHTRRRSSSWRMTCCSGGSEAEGSYTSAAASIWDHVTMGGWRPLLVVLCGLQRSCS